MFNEINSTEVSSIKNIIGDIAKNEIRHANIPTYIAAVVQKINDDGTINVYIPPNVSNSVTGLLNKCNEPLSVGDSVEIGTKNGSLSNCWVALKHGTTYPTKGIIDLQEQIDLLKKEIEKGVFEKAYPIGSIYINAEDDTNPSVLFGIGVWEKLEDMFLLGAGNDYLLGDTGGEVDHILTVDEIPSHKHLLTVYNDDFSNGGDANRTAAQKKTSPGFTYDVALGANAWTYDQISNVGGGQAHNNMPPYQAVNMWKRIS